MSLSFTLTALWFKKIKWVIELLWAVSSVTFTCGMVITGVYWLTEPTTKWPTMVASSTVISATPGGEATIPETGVGVTQKVIYRIELVNAEGVVHHTYPEVVMDGQEAKILGGVNLKLPEGLVPGVYTMRADMKYPINPIKTEVSNKTNDLKIELAQIVVR